jgi:GTPase SAR1 family protein
MKKVLKILVLGERSVGKTTLLQYYCSGISKKVKHTVGCQIHIKRLPDK